VYGSIFNEPFHDAEAQPGNDATEAEHATDAEVRMGPYVTEQPPCHALDKDKWCDRNGPGDFMGHTCWPVPETFHEPPSYYNRGGFHCFDVMDALGLFTKYYIASAFTYIWRCDFKGDAAEALRDLKKARRYLDWEIKRRETATERTTRPEPLPTASIQTPKEDVQPKEDREPFSGGQDYGD
jgi:hypothetical protein